MKLTEDQFLKDVKDHELTILKDDGIYRHLRFSRPECSNMSYEIINTPYYLTMVGDMGSWTWSRLEDNFCFFRQSESTREYNKKEGRRLGVNPSYWAEKLQAIDRGGLSEFDDDCFKEHVMDAYKDWLEEDDYSQEQRDEVKELLRDEVLISETLEEAHRNISEYDNLSDTGATHGFSFSDAWEWDLTRYKDRYVWACYAVAYAVEQYDIKIGEGS